jgi:hypothetical protein
MRRASPLKTKKFKKTENSHGIFFFFLQFNLTWSQKLMFTFTQFYSKIFFICTQNFNNIGSIEGGYGHSRQKLEK